MASWPPAVARFSRRVRGPCHVTLALVDAHYQGSHFHYMPIKHNQLLIIGISFVLFPAAQWGQGRREVPAGGKERRR